MKRPLILLVAIGLVCVFPATAVAGKGGKPEPATVDVTMAGNIATTCTGPLTMHYGDKGGHTLNAGDREWARQCVYLSLNGLEPGCYCGHHQDNQDPSAFAGVFRLDEQRDGTVELISQLERLWVITTNPKNGKTRSVLNSAYSLQGVLEGDFNWTLDSGGGTLTGDLVLKYFFKEVGSATGTWTEISITPVTINVGW